MKQKFCFSGFGVIGTVCFCTISLLLFFAGILWIEQKEIVSSAEALMGRGVRDHILGNLKKSQEAFEHMARIWGFNRGTPRPLWEEEANLVFSQLPGLKEVVWVNSNGETAWIAGDHRSLKTKTVLNEGVMELAKAERTDTVSGVYNENGGLVGFSLYVPIYSKTFFDGYIVGVFDINRFIKNSLPREGMDRHRVFIAHGGNDVVKINNEQLVSETFDTQVPLNLLGLDLTIFVKAVDGVEGAVEYYLPSVLVFVALFMMLLTLLLVYSIKTSSKRKDEQEKLLSQLSRANNIINEQDRLVSLGTLTAGMAHEVKNPLNIMTNFSELSVEIVEEIKHILEENNTSFSVEDKESLREALDTLLGNLMRISDQGKRANNTIQSVLTHSKGTREPGLTDIHQLLDEYLNLSYYSYRFRDPIFNAKITKRYDVTAPKIQVVAEDISRVFLNLFNNAYYTLTEKKKKLGASFVPELIVSTFYTSEYLEIRIRDNGFGVAEAVKEKIFTPFFTTKPANLGTGLGLSISYAIISEQGGLLDFISKEGEFTEFHITLPVKKQTPTDPHWVLAEHS